MNEGDDARLSGDGVGMLFQVLDVANTCTPARMPNLTQTHVLDVHAKQI